MDVKERNQWAMFCHLSALCGIMIPFGNVVAPAVLWQMKKDADPYIDEQGKEVVNFQVFLAIIGIGLYLMTTMFPLAHMMESSATGFSLGYASIRGLIWLAIFGFAIAGALKAKEGVAFKYPMPFKFIS